MLECRRPTGKIDIVHGKPITLRSLCEYERAFWGSCKKSGKFWVEDPLKVKHEQNQ